MNICIYQYLKCALFGRVKVEIDAHDKSIVNRREAEFLIFKKTLLLTYILRRTERV